MKSTQPYDASTEFLRIPEVRLLLTELITPSIAPPTLLRLFAGLRAGEADHWVGEPIGGRLFDRRLLLCPKLKGMRRYRSVPVCPALAAWLEPYRTLAGITVRTRNADRFLRRQAAARRLKLAHNVFRQTYALYRLALTRDMALVGQEIGMHPKLVRQPLWLPVSHAEAEEFFKLTPQDCGRPQWPDEVDAWAAATTHGA